VQRGDENADMLFKNLSAWCAEHTREEIYRSAQARSAPVGPIYSPSEVMASEQEAARGFFRPLNHEVAGTLQYTTTSALYSQAAPPPNAAAPLLGEANGHLLAPSLSDGWSAATARRAGVA
ncbi:MAG: CoA transferase, partial [Chloroflexi bacterium]|nr:CoA transferase [Chloroflexota bacterium]